jgi:hypothetical protein
MNILDIFEIELFLILHLPRSFIIIKDINEILTYVVCYYESYHITQMSDMYNFINLPGSEQNAA